MRKWTQKPFKTRICCILLLFCATLRYAITDNIVWLAFGKCVNDDDDDDGGGGNDNDRAHMKKQFHELHACNVYLKYTH